MEEIELFSWETLNGIKKSADVIETVGNLQNGHYMSVFCSVEDDFLELFYSDSGSNFLRRYEDREELEMAIEKRKEDAGEIPYEEERGLNGSFEEIDDEEKFKDS